MHLDDERVQRLLHHELGKAEAETMDHLSRCAACRDRAKAARAEEAHILGLLTQMDHPPPAVDPRALFPEEPRMAARWSRRAAAILTGAVIAGAAYAAPGSPLPEALDRLLGGRPAVRAPATVPDSDSVAPAGVAIAPGEALVIRLISAGEVDGTIALTDDEGVVVRALGGTVTFSSDPGHLAVRSSGRTRLEILVPRAAPSVEILVDTAVVFTVRSGGIDATLPLDPTGRYAISIPRESR